MRPLNPCASVSIRGYTFCPSNGLATLGRVELKDQATTPTLAQKLGDTAHVSGLAIRLARVSGAGGRLPEWLLKVAVERGAKHYQRDFDPSLPPDNPTIPVEEIGVALCLGQLPYDPMAIRAAAQLLSSPKTDPKQLTRLAVMERVEPVLLYVAALAERFVPELEPWAYLRAHLHSRRAPRADALPHWSRFVSQTGYTPAGRGQHIEWLVRDE